MRRRQLKKFALNARENRKPYDQARGKGSKKLCRRLKTMRRYWRAGPHGPAGEALDRASRDLGKAARSLILIAGVLGAKAEAWGCPVPDLTKFKRLYD